MKKILLVFLTTCLIISCSNESYYFDHMIEVTSLKQIRSIETFSVQKPTEVVIEGMFLVKPNLINEFSSINHFITLAEAKENPDFYSKSNIARHFVDKNEWLNIAVLFGRTQNNKWEFVLDKATGRCQFQLLSVDFSDHEP